MEHYVCTQFCSCGFLASMVLVIFAEGEGWPPWVRQDGENEKHCKRYEGECSRISNAYANETNPRHRGTPRSTPDHHNQNKAVAVYRVEFLNNDPLHLFGQRHGMSCASLSSRPYIPMGLFWTNKYKTTPLCQIWNLPCNVCNMNPLLHTRTHVR